jgi:hypothetical protein
VGVVSGGTSVDSIAAEAQMQVDMRSNAEPELLALEEEILGLEEALDKAWLGRPDRAIQRSTHCEQRGHG